MFGQDLAARYLKPVCRVVLLPELADIIVGFLPAPPLPEVLMNKLLALKAIESQLAEMKDRHIKGQRGWLVTSAASSFVYTVAASIGQLQVEAERDLQG